MRRRITTLAAVTRIAAASAAVVLAACAKKDAPADAEVQAVVNAQTVLVAPSSFTETLGAIGNVVARAGHVATLSAPSASRVERVLVTTGQSVRAGETVIELDQAPFQASLQSAQAALTAAERANERQQRLANEGIVPKKDAESAAADLARAQSEEIAARRAAQLSILKSPISGVVTRMAATLGASADPSQPLVEISDPTKLDVLMSVTPTDAARVRAGAKVALSAGQTASGESLGTGLVVDISGAVDTATRSVAVRVQAPTTRRPLRIGETIFGAIAVTFHSTAIVIPNDALVPNDDKFKVFVVDATNVAHEREVTVGGKSAAGVEITEGLKAGERIVTTGAYAMQDSAKVAPLTGLPDSAKPATPVKP
jgi:membrane fusion protein (multidrug efflux system)